MEDDGSKVEGKIDLLDSKIDHVLELLTSRYVDLERRIASLEDGASWLTRVVGGLVVTAVLAVLLRWSALERQP